MRDSNGEILGVTQIINKLPESSIFTSNDELLLEAFSALAAATIERSLLFDKIQNVQLATANVQHNLDTILFSITDVVMTLSPEGILVIQSLLT
jgi:GAF domain-containing protein